HDPAHVHARPRHHLQLDADGAVVAVDVGDRVDLGEGVADVAERGGDRVGGQLQQRAREHRAFLQDHQALEVFLGQYGVAGELDRRDGVDLALGQPGGDVHVALVGADRDLGAVDAEVDVAAVEVEVVQLLQV